MASNRPFNDERRGVRNPMELRFTQLDINPAFSDDPKYPKVAEAITLIRRGRLDPADFGELTVHRDKEEEGVVWCENNRRLYVLRMAGVPSVSVKFVNSDYMSRRMKEDKIRLKDPYFLPRIRGQTSGVQIPFQPMISAQGSTHVDVGEEQKGSSLQGLVGAVSAAAAVAYWGWKLFNGDAKPQAEADRDGEE